MVVSSRERPWALWKCARESWPIGGITWNKQDWKRLNANCSTSVRGSVCPNTEQGMGQAETLRTRSQWLLNRTKVNGLKLFPNALTSDIIVGYKMWCPIKKKSFVTKKSFACHSALRTSLLKYYVWFWALHLENSGLSRVKPEESNENGSRYVSSEENF